ncbi:FG-GAP-like repeat-containing protein [Aquisphaera insulae]|uniref:FG-GAP-like repeat-containing protein n=1 Tax=Aquisphaera insulae TaxID=2712864 RepID=UPI0013EB2F64|nr:FG-GAP-like repeat-containing protein [Aquisphaera insulae]
MPSARSRSQPRWLIPTLGLVAIALLSLGIAVVVRWSDMGREPTWPEIREAMASRQTDRALTLLERWIARHPDHAEAVLSLAELRLGSGRRDGVTDLLATVPESNRSWGAAQQRLGELLIEERRAAEAEAILRRLAAREPKAVPPRQRLVYLLSLQQRTAEARELLWDLRRILNDPRILVDLVLQILVDPQDVRSLPPELEEFVRKTPDDPFLRRAWGLERLYRGEPEEALPHLQAAAGRLENDPIGRLALAECRIALGMVNDPDTILGPCPENPADAASWWIARGRLAESAGSIDRAVESFEQAVRRMPASREAHIRLAHVLERRGPAERAREELARVERLTERIRLVYGEHRTLRRTGVPRDAAHLERLGTLCVEAGLIREGRAWLQEAIAIDPRRESARGALVKLAEIPDSLPFVLARPTRREERSPAEPKIAGLPEGGSSNPLAGDAAAAISSVPGLSFEDRAREAGIDYRYDCGASQRMHIAETMGGGVGLIDFDGDGNLDIYFVNGCSLPFDPAHPPAPNRLYRNLGNGRFEDVTASTGVGGAGFGMGCTVADYDGDGHPDLLVTGLHRTILYRNRGDGRFEDVTARAGLTTDRWTTAAGFGDLDGDGDLDLVVVTYVEARADEAPECRDGSGRRMHCAPTRFSAQADLLYRNDGNGTFTDVSRESGFERPNGRGLGLAIADFDDDGKLDVFIANDSSANFLYRNLGGLRFEEIGFVSGVATKGSGQVTANMGVAAEDLDQDGKIDLFVTNLVNESSTLFRNLGQLLFVDATLGAGLEAPSRSKTGFGNAALDANNDGILDLFVANGDIDDRPWANNPMAQTPLFFVGRPAGHFGLVRPSARFPYLGRQWVGRGVAAGDLNNDGRVDLVVVHRDATAAILMNETPGGHWLGVKLKGRRSGPTPFGACVTCRSGDRTERRWLTSGPGYLSSHDPRLWFGLGDRGRVDRLEVKWPSGLLQSWPEVPGDRIVELIEGESTIVESKKGGPEVASGTALR